MYQIHNIKLSHSLILENIFNKIGFKYFLVNSKYEY